MKRILVVGGGLIGIRHIEAVQAHSGCTLVGLADPDMTIQTDAKRFASMDAVDGAVNGVIIATPTHLHAPHGIQAAARGWHMLIEKPVAGTLQDARQLEAALQTASVRSLVGHHRRYHAPVQQLKSVLSDGLIGDVVTVSLIWAMRKPDPYFQGNWRTAGGSPVMINLVHDIDLMRFCIGEIAQTAALRGASLRGTDRIESGAVALVFENGATGTISFADNAPSPWGFEAGTGENPNIGTTQQDMMWITGTKGAISFPSLTLWHGTDWGSPAQVRPFAAHTNTQTPLAAQLDHFISVMDGASPLIDVADATRTLAIAQQIETQLTPNSVGKAAQYA
ncbi:Gfo/Idh/MocA family oxidoreductase [uncultured Sulfitobacter sp.]|uniref:Gfo/Idh/MocA family protein n=1 Tax=uncultured Sulfitobacter sp. TaxID=191468 RepID=UPI002634C0E4|nr:Gfo/Idh/MocA family oxidoreductase [uncultured Sulfitobacter sp.]